MTAVIDPHYTIQVDDKGSYSVIDNTGKQKITTGFSSYEFAEAYIEGGPQEVPDLNPFKGSNLLEC